MCVTLCSNNLCILYLLDSARPLPSDPCKLISRVCFPICDRWWFQYLSGRRHGRVPNGEAGTSPNGVRQSQVFHGYPAYPPNPTVGGAAMPPSLHDGMGHLGGPVVSNTTGVTAAAAKSEEEDRNTALFGDLPEAKRRKFILVEDPHRGGRVRVRVMLDQVEMKEIPDSYRKTNCVYPRSYFPMQMQSPPTSARGSRFFEDDDADGEVGQPTKGRTLVPVPMLDGAEGEVAVPKITKTKRGKEVTLNDLGYRMSWSQSRVFAGRTMFLQRARESSMMPAV